MDLVFTEKNERLNVRVGILIENKGRYLVINDNHATYDYIIGGRIKKFETSLKAAKREVLEELGQKCQDFVLKFTYESFFYEPTLKLNFHELGYIYMASLDSKSAYLDKDRIYRDDNTFKWISLDKPAKPQFIFDYLKKYGVPKAVVHIVSKE